MRDWRWKQLGKFGGMVVLSGYSVLLSVQWSRSGGAVVAQWWVAGHMLRKAEIGQA